MTKSTGAANGESDGDILPELISSLICCSSSALLTGESLYARLAIGAVPGTSSISCLTVVVVDVGGKSSTIRSAYRSCSSFGNSVVETSDVVTHSKYFSLIGFLKSWSNPRVVSAIVALVVDLESLSCCRIFMKSWGLLLINGAPSIMEGLSFVGTT